MSKFFIGLKIARVQIWGGGLKPPKPPPSAYAPAYMLRTFEREHIPYVTCIFLAKYCVQKSACPMSTTTVQHDNTAAAAVVLLRPYWVSSSSSFSCLGFLSDMGHPFSLLSYACMRACAYVYNCVWLVPRAFRSLAWPYSHAAHEQGLESKGIGRAGFSFCSLLMWEKA